MNKLKQRWNITSNFQFFTILMVFAITGSTSALIAKPILTFIGITKESVNIWLYYPLYIIIILPIYKILLLFIGTLAGQRDFFWNFKTPYTGDSWISIPKPFESGLISSMVSRGISMQQGNGWMSNTIKHGGLYCRIVKHIFKYYIITYL